MLVGHSRNKVAEVPLTHGKEATKAATVVYLPPEADDLSGNRLDEAMTKAHPNIDISLSSEWSPK